MARRYAQRASLVPDVTELLKYDEHAAMIEAYIEQHCAEDQRAELRAAIAMRRSDEVGDAIWLHMEIAFALGVEIGKRLGGDR